MNKGLFSLIAGIALLLAATAAAQSRNAYIGYVYPAGGQRGTVVQLRIGGQRLDDVTGADISGEGVTAKIINCFQRLSPNDIRLIREQLQIIQQEEGEPDEETRIIAERIQERIDEDQRQPASQALATVVLVEVTIDKKATPGRREIRLLTPLGPSNPLSFYVGHLPETSRKAMKISKFQTLGKEHLALRNRPEDEEEITITLPCTVNGQIASGEINRYRFHAQKDEKLVITTLARRLVPYIADAVPGWFQPVITLHNSDGKEMAFNDDFRFKPDPTLLYQVPETGDYILSIHDSIYRGREDFVYRITLGDAPFITSVFPPGGTVGEDLRPKLDGWNLGLCKLRMPPADAQPGVHFIAADRSDALSNYIPFVLDTLPECVEQKNPIGGTQKLKLPIIVNGRIEQPGDSDTFRFTVREAEPIVAEVHARRLDSPLDSIITLTDDDGKLIAVNDDHSDPGSGLNTHHADSYLRLKLPCAGTYKLTLTDTARAGGETYTYRLRLSHPRPDFALRTMPSMLNFRGKSGAPLEIFVIRKDGFEGAVTVTVDPDNDEFNAWPITIGPDEEKKRMYIKTTKTDWDGPVAIHVLGTADIDGRERTRRAVPAEDWMQAFLWRHLVPSQELLAYHHKPNPKRPLPEEPDISFLDKIEWKNKNPQERQIASRTRQILQLYQDNLLTDDLYTQTLTGLLDFNKEDP